MSDEEASPDNKVNKNGRDVLNSMTEATENDPCMECDKKNEKNAWRKYELMIREKTGLRRKGLYFVGALLVVLLCLLIIVTVLGATWPIIPHSQRYPVCKDTACLTAITQVREALNSSVSPCTDAWNWACGGWINKYSLPPERSIWNQEEQIKLNEARRVRDLINTLPLPLHSGTVEWKLKHLYDACIDIDNVNADQARPLTHIISELGGWYILRNWNMEDFDGKFVMRQLHVKYGVTPYFKVSVEPNPISPGQSSITIKPSGLGLPDKIYYYTESDSIHRAYKQLIRDVVIYLSATTTEAEKFANDIYHYEKRIAEITPDSYNLQNPINAYNLYKLSELKESTLMLPLLDILMAMYPESNVTEDTEIVLYSYEYLTRVSQIVATTDRTTMNSYLIWTLVHKYLPYLSTKFTSAVDSFDKVLFGTKAPIKRWEFCINLVQKFMGHATSTLIGKEFSITESSRKVVESIFGSIKNTTTHLLTKYSRRSSLYRHLLTKVLNLKLQFDFSNETDLKSYYTKLIVIKANLFENFRNGLMFLKKLEERRLKNIKSNLTDHSFNVYYSASSNNVVVPRTILTEPNFQIKYPVSVVYARLGTDIANAIVSSILPFDNIWTADLKVLSPYHMTVNESIEVVDPTINCLSGLIERYSFIKWNTNLTALSTLKFLTSLKIAYYSLVKELERFDHTHQPTLEDYEDPQLFFLTYFQKMCSFVTEQRTFYDSAAKFILPQKSLLQLISIQSGEFEESFECSPNSKKEKCDGFF